MVRANELGCRNGWNADLWVPADKEGTNDGNHIADPIGARAKAEVAPPGQDDLLTFFRAARTDNAPVAAEQPAPAPVPSPPIGEDIFVQQTPSMSWKREPVSAQPATELVQDPRAAIHRAREQFRQRRKSEGRLADRHLSAPLIPEIASKREAQLTDTSPHMEVEPPPDSVDPRYENRQLLPAPASEPAFDRRPVSPVSLKEIDRPFPSMTDFPEDRTRFESVPVLESAPVEVTAPDDALLDDTWIETRQLDTVPPEPYMVDEFFDDDEVVAQPEPQPYFEEEELSVRHRESVLDRFLRHRRERRQAPQVVDEPLDSHYASVDSEPTRARPIPVEQRPAPPVALESPVAPAPREQHATLDTPGYDRHWNDERPVRQEARRSDIHMRSWPDSRARTATVATVDDDLVLPPPLPAIEPIDRSDHQDDRRARHRYEPAAPSTPSRHQNGRFDRAAESEFGDRPLFADSPAPRPADVTYDRPAEARSPIASQVHRMERICRTCRDFRPAENGDRGWCNNKWAFSHRRMVDADDLACRNSLGSWWTPKDEVWRRDGDISRHAQQTPRVDEWLFGTHDESNDRRRSGS